MEKQWKVRATVTHRRDGWHTTVPVPEFIVEADSREAARLVAESIVNPAALPSEQFSVTTNVKGVR